MPPFSKLMYLKYLQGVEMKASTFRVLVCVFNYTDMEGRKAFPGVDLLAHDACMSPSTVKRALKDLSQLGWLTLKQRGRSIAGMASRYELSAPPDAIANYEAAKEARRNRRRDHDDAGTGQSVARAGQDASNVGVASEPPTDDLTDHAASEPCTSGETTDRDGSSLDNAFQPPPDDAFNSALDDDFYFDDEYDDSSSQ